MTHEEYLQQYRHYADMTERRLAEVCDVCFAEDSRIGRAARYSLLGGGKRVRAVLTLATCDLVKGEEAVALDYACALEMVHCHSLIHDDLPCMDNDDTRRGRPSCHKQFEEDTALLAGDALLAAAFSVIANAEASAQSRIAATQILAQGTGGRGMLYGQELDKRYESAKATEEQLLELHRHKTGELILAAVRLGYTSANSVFKSIKNALEAYASSLGLGFQIVDDILDVTASTEQLGKPSGSDISNGKTTFITLYGLEGARVRARTQTQNALIALESLPQNADFLCFLAKDLLEREK